MGSDVAVELTSPVAATIYALSNSGVAVGSRAATAGTTGGSGTRAVRWDAAATAGALLDAPGTDAAFTEAADVNAAGTAAGQALAYDQSNALVGRRAIRWDAGSTGVDVLALPSPAAGGPTPLTAGGRGAQRCRRHRRHQRRRFWF